MPSCSRLIAFFRRRAVVLTIFCVTTLFFLPVVLDAKLPLSANFLVSFFNPWSQEKFTGWDQGIPYKPVGIDDLRIFYPQRLFTQAVLNTGQLPFWNPYSFSGNYHIGLSETAVFYPPFLIFFIFPQAFSWLIMQIFLPVIGFAGMYYFLRFHLTRPYALFGGIVFGFSGIVLVRMVEGLSVGHTLIWLPYALWGVDGYFKEKKIRFLFLLTGSMVLSVLAGWFQFSFYLICYSFLYVAWRLITSREKKLLLNYLILIPFALVPLLTLFHILPALDTLFASPRTNSSIENLQAHLLPLSHVFTLFYPDYWGNPATLSFFGPSEYKESIVYIGVIPALLALFSLIHILKHRTTIVFFAMTGLIAFLLGNDGIVGRWFVELELPMISSFLPDRTMYIVSFALCVLSAYGMKAFIEEKKNRWLGAVMVSFIMIMILILAHRLIIPYLPINIRVEQFLLYWFEPINAYFDGRPGIFVDPLKAIVQAKNVIIGDVLIAIFFIVLIGRRMIGRKGAIALLFIATIAGQLYFAYKYIPFSYVKFIFPAHPVFSYLQKEAGNNRFITAGDGYIPSNLSLPYKIYSPDGVSSMYPLRYGEFISYAIHGGETHNVPRIESRIEVNASQLLMGENAYVERFMQIDGVKYVVVLVKDVPEKINSKFKKVWTNENWVIFEYRNVAARAFWTNKYEVVEDKRLLSRLFDRTLEKNEVLLEKEPKIPRLSSGSGMVRIVDYTPNKIVIETASDSDGLVYLSDNFTPNFIAYVDDEKVELLRANFTFRAVSVRKGDHRIVFQYHDKGFDQGVLVAVLTLITSIGGFIWLSRKNVGF